MNDCFTFFLLNQLIVIVKSLDFDIDFLQMNVNSKKETWQTTQSVCFLKLFHAVSIELCLSVMLVCDHTDLKFIKVWNPKFVIKVSKYYTYEDQLFQQFHVLYKIIILCLKWICGRWIKDKMTFVYSEFTRLYNSNINLNSTL